MGDGILGPLGRLVETPPGIPEGPVSEGPTGAPAPGRKRGRPVTKMTDQAKVVLAMGVASGEKKIDMARDLNVAPATVSRALKEPEVLELVAKFRRANRVQNVEGAQRVAQLAAQRAEHALLEADPKGFQAYTQGWLNTERIAASASGELKPVGPTVTITQQTANLAVEGQELIAALLGARS